jgi:hypothetical protein
MPLPSFGRLPNRARRPTRPARRLTVEPLEDRTLPSTLAAVPVYDSSLPASVSSGGVSQPFVSYDGRYVVYTGLAPNLVANQVNEAPVANIYLYDTQTGSTTLVSHLPSQPTTGADAPSAFASISGDDRYIVYSSEATDLVPGQDGVRNGVRGFDNVFLYTIATGTNTLISHASGAPSVSGNDASSTETTTGFGFNQNSGRYLIFASRATDLVPGQDAASHYNLFLYDTQLNTTTLVSHVPGSPTTGGDDDSLLADISQDGGLITYVSLADDLVPGQTGQQSNAFLYDNRPLVNGSPNPNFGSNFLVSGAYNPATGGPSANVAAGYVTAASISADGSFIGYLSAAPNLVAGQSTDFDSSTGQFYAPSPNVFGLSLHTGKTYLLSGAATPNGASPSVMSNGLSYRLAISGDGSSVAFLSDASDLYPTQTGEPGQGRNTGNIFLDRLSTANPSQKTVFLVSNDADVFAQTGVVVPASGAVSRKIGVFTDLSISADGQYVTYQAHQIAGQTGRLVLGQAPPPGAGDDIWNSFDYYEPLGSTQQGTNSLLSRVNGTAATTGNLNTTAARISGNGRAIAFVSQATNLQPSNLGAGAPVASNGANLFVYPAFGSGPLNLSSQAIVQASAQTYVWGTSQDGRYVVFTSNSPLVVPGQVDTNSDQDVFVYDSVAGITELVSHVPGAPLTTGNAGSPNTIDGTQPPGPPVVISQDGNWIVFVSDATNLTAGQTGIPQTNNLYLFDNRPGPTYGTVTLITSNPLIAGQAGDDNSFNPVISADGNDIVFVSYAKNILPGLVSETLGDYVKGNVYLYVRTTGQLFILSDKDATSTTGNGDSGSPSISDSGRYVAFESHSTNLISGTVVQPVDNVYLVDTVAMQTTLVSHTASSTTGGADAASFDPVVSPDGSSVAFVSFATDLVAGQSAPAGTQFSNVFRYDVASGTVSLVSGSGGSATATADGFSDSPAVSADGSRVAFRSSAPDVVPGQTNTPGSTSNVFLFDGNLQTVTLLSHACDASGCHPTTTAAGNSEAPSIDGAGILVVYVSTATNLVPGQQEAVAVKNVFLYSTTVGGSALLSGQDGSPTVASSSPTYLAVVSRDPVGAFNSLSGRGGASVAYINRLVQVNLSPSTVANGSPAGTPIGTLSVDSVFAGQYLPPAYQLAAGDQASFAVGPTRGGRAALLTRFQANSAAKSVYPITVYVDAGFGNAPYALVVDVSGGGPPPPPPPGPRPLGVRMVRIKVGKRKRRWMVDVFYADTGAEKELLPSPFQGASARGVRASFRDSNGDGIPDEIVLTPRKGKGRPRVVPI